METFNIKMAKRKREEINNVILFDPFFFLVLEFSSTGWIQKKKKNLDLFPNENILYFCDGLGRIHQLGSTRENGQTLFRGVQHGLNIRDDSRNVGGDERFLKENASATVTPRRVNKRRTLMFKTVAAL